MTHARRISKRNRRFLEARPSQRLLLGGKGWYWHAIVMGADIVVHGALATWWGGPNDPEDIGGETASGVNTIDTPDIMGCALPISGHGVKSLEGSPLPKLPFHIAVRVHVPGNHFIDTTLIDLGPSRYTNHAIDLTTTAFQKLGGDLKKGLLSVDYVIVGGAAYL